jgi:hypothetical protein
MAPLLKKPWRRKVLLARNKSFLEAGRPRRQRVKFFFLRINYQKTNLCNIPP